MLPMSEATWREPPAGTGLGHREISLTRTDDGSLEVRNERGGRMRLGNGKNEDFAPVELMLAALAGCSAVDVEAVTSRRAVPDSFEVTCSGEKRKDEHGNYLADLEVRFTVRFPDGPDGDRARDMLPRAISMSHDRLCTVTQTVQRGTPVTVHQA